MHSPTQVPTIKKGTVKSYDKSCGTGVISQSAEDDIRFYEDSVLGKSRAGLKQGDLVWFEVSNIKNLHIAINIRKA